MTARSVGTIQSGCAMVLASLLLLPAEARPGELPKATIVTVGSRVRILAPTMVHGRLEGMVLEMDENSLLVGMDDRGPIRLPREAITRLDVSTGRHRRALKGMIIGAGIGVATLGLAAATYHSDGGGSSDSTSWGAAVGQFALGGAAWGAGIGALIKSDRWSPVPLDTVRVGLGPTRGRGVALSVSVGF